MPMIRPSAAAVRAARAAVMQQPGATSALVAAAPRRHLPTTTTTQTQMQSRAASHGSQYDPPTGWLFGVKPGEKYQKEGWENMFFYGFCGSLVVFTIAYAFKPDTSIQTWALEEARRRLEAEGILEDPEKKL
ncbi:ESSS subunit of NADH:ubiquinone oxidoreductase-domain-containing protein [Phialemonium atrogriseum]|uniref:NADH dehydrogenase [ubiquinone] 1 beta subcomplex subunit 11, mitochondrial n=1 Tax=Phialemonium atrogriseum TaxID=1093897 RepID=A0AAJ0C0D7_9PEZI|nr:ESSS subunit of NADH:ubiquinone oxidoreductase-domain-containing protein [Phialemonium atrogriseum]KAK1767635.1 ESSS subunit of NADH:ubiquinone oxidoreductase-domain-containing protein [Phialemonium atrogriseum]